jgi:hypothetical protein
MLKSRLTPSYAEIKTPRCASYLSKSIRSNRARAAFRPPVQSFPLIASRRQKELRVEQASTRWQNG